MEFPNDARTSNKHDKNKSDNQDSEYLPDDDSEIYNLRYRADNNIRTFSELKDLINADNNEIVLENDFYFGRYEQDQLISIVIEGDNLIIDGNGHIIDALGRNRIFIIDAENVHLKNIIFRNAFSTVNAYHSADGGAIYVLGGNVTIENCKFVNNHSISGGAIYNRGGTVTILNCEFEHNSAELMGGAICAFGNLHAFNCTFNSNTSISSAGACFRGYFEECCFKNNTSENGGACSDSNLKSCKFYENHAQDFGGAVSNYLHDVDITDCEFVNNSSRGFGGACNDGTLVDCTFKNNHSKNGGAFFGEGTLNNCHFINNYCENHGYSIYSEEILEINGCDFIDKFSKGDDVIYYEGKEDCSLTITGSKFDSKLSKIINVGSGFCFLEYVKNQNSNRYVVYNGNGVVQINKCNFDSQNRLYNNNILKIWSYEIADDKIIKSSNSKIIYLDYGIPYDLKGFTYFEELINNCSGVVNIDEDISMDIQEQSFYEGGIELNQDNLVIDGHGHTIDANGLSRIFFITGKNITLKNIIFKNGMDFPDKFSQSSGGSIFTFKGCDLTIINCQFINSISKNFGGVIHNRGNSLKIINSTFRDNHSLNGSAGVIYNEGLLEINCCEFLDNSAKDYGGVIYSKNSIVTCENSNFDNNFSKTSSGGSIQIDSGELYLVNSRFKNNRSEKEGGAICSSAKIVIKNSEFKGNANVSSFGGAIKSYYNASLIIDSTDFSNNRSKYSGGAIENSGEFEINNSNFQENESESEGGAFFNNWDSDLIMSKMKFIKNKSSGSGGAIYNMNKLTVKDSEFKDNYSGYSGGAIDGTDELTIVDCVFDNNHAEENGGAILNFGEVQFKKSKFINNSSKKFGGVLYFSKDYSLESTGCVFIGNSSGEGCIEYPRNVNAYFDNCIFENNYTLNVNKN